MHQLNTDCAGGVTPDHKAGLCQQILFHLLALAFCTFSVIAVCAEPVECRGCLQESLPGRRVALLLRVPRGPGSFGTCQQKSRVQHSLCRLDGLQRTFLVMCTLHRVPGLCSAQRSASRPGPVGTSAPGVFLSLHSPETPQTPPAGTPPCSRAFLEATEQLPGCFFELPVLAGWCREQLSPSPHGVRLPSPLGRLQSTLRFCCPACSTDLGPSAPAAGGGRHRVAPRGP